MRSAGGRRLVHRPLGGDRRAAGGPAGRRPVERVVDLVRDCAFVRREEREEMATLRPLPTAEPDEEAPVC